MRPVHPRSTTSEESVVLRTALSITSGEDSLRDLAATLEDLVVTAVCECGCASVSFGPEPEPGDSRPIADCIGRTPDGGDVGVLVWASRERLSGLEVYDLGAGEGHLVLPLPESLRPFPKGEPHGVL